MAELDWPECRNVRDLGGLPTTDGALTRNGALIRSDSHFRLTAAGVAAVRATGVSRILDLRWARELDSCPSPFAAEDIYRHVPMLEEKLSYEVPDDSYIPMLEHNGTRIAAAFRAIAGAPPGAVVIHCHGGRDRTGALAALALGVAGVSADEIAADYARTPGCDALAMRNTLAHVGDPERYLRSIGVTGGEILEVRRRLRVEKP